MDATRSEDREGTHHLPNMGGLLFTVRGFNEYDMRLITTFLKGVCRYAIVGRCDACIKGFIVVPGEKKSFIRRKMMSTLLSESTWRHAVGSPAAYADAIKYTCSKICLEFGDIIGVSNLEDPGPDTGIRQKTDDAR